MQNWMKLCALGCSFAVVMTFAKDLLVREVKGTKMAVAGDVAKGVVLEEKGDDLYLDATPCKKQEDKEVIRFHKPYFKEDGGTVKCGEKTYRLTQVTQE